MPALWYSKVTFISVSQFWGLALCSPFGSVSGPFVTPRLIVSLGGRKTRERNLSLIFFSQKEKKNSSLVTLNLFGEF